MNYLVYRQEGNLGPYTLDELRAQLAAGAILPEDLAWTDGMAQWASVTTVLSAETARVSPTIPATTAAPATPVADNASAEATRHQYLAHEQSVRSIGTLYYFNGGLLLVSALCIGLVGALTGKMGPVVEGVIFLVISLVLFWVAGKFRRLSRSAIIPGAILAVIGLLGVPFGTLLNAFFLYLMFCEKGKFVFSEAYQAIVAATPQIEWRTSLWAKILIGLAIVVSFAVIIISMVLALGQQVQTIKPH